MFGSVFLLNAEQNITVKVVSPVDATEIKVPKAIIPPQVHTKYEKKSANESHKKEDIKNPHHEEFGVRFPPHYNEIKNDISMAEEDRLPGDIKNGRVSAYLTGKYLSEQQFVTRLKKNGFIDVAIYPVDPDGNYISIVFTSKELMDASSAHEVGFNATLRALINKKDKTISIVNPRYQLKAFMQDSYNEKLADNILTQMRKAFALKDSNQWVKFSSLSHYSFMKGMPEYKNMQIVAMANSNRYLLEKANRKKKAVFNIRLKNGAYLVGVELSKQTASFVKSIGYANAELLPYPVLIEDNQAKILDPRYYIALMYPSLTPGKFMQIAKVPDMINKECSKIFR